jgi:phage-related protein
MANFPALKTGAFAQYPSDRTQNFSTQVYRFLDGSEQRFPAYGAALRRWVIRLDLLDEAELTALQDFFVSEGGRAGAFSFTDPFDSTVYENCSFAADELDLTFGGFAEGKTTVTIRQVSGA